MQFVRYKISETCWMTWSTWIWWYWGCNDYCKNLQCSQGIHLTFLKNNFNKIWLAFMSSSEYRIKMNFSRFIVIWVLGNVGLRSPEDAELISQESLSLRPLMLLPVKSNVILECSEAQNWFKVLTLFFLNGSNMPPVTVDFHCYFLLWVISY